MRLSHRLLLAVLLFCAILPQHLPAADAPAGITVTSRRVDSLAASNLLSAYDAGDGYAGAKGRRTLLRLRDGVAVRVKANEPGAKLSDLTAKGSALEGFQVQVQRKDRFALLRGKVSTNQAPAAMNSRLAELRRTPGLEAVNPVFVDPASGLWVMTSDEIIIALKPGIAAKDYFGADWRRVRPMLGPPGQYVLTLSNLESEAVFAAAQRHAADARVLWAEPNFISQGLTQLIPNDPQFTNQWHLLNTGQTGGTPGADIRVTAAWDRTNGSPNVIVAVLDNGFDLSHPDLVANIATNTMEIPGNGIDDDNNGYADDIRGWNYFEANNDPSPVTVYDNHGTEVAGAAIAAGNNGVGIAGVAYGCRLLPLRIGEASTPGSFSSRDTDIANAIYYGSGGISQSDSWRGADVLVMSFESIQVTVVDDALTFATSQAHNGQGVPVFVAMGNHGDGWRTVVVNGFTAGNFTLAWTYSKNATTAAGEDAVWLSQVTFPDGTTERFDGATFPPAGWSTSGNANWTRESDPAHARGASLFTARSGVIGDNQSTTLQTTRTVTAGTLTYVFWVSSEQDADIFSLSVNGTPQTFANVSGVPFIRLGPSYPASHPSVISVGASSHWDTRSSYSQYGGKIDLVAPGGGSGGADVITTDRAGTAGDNMAASPAGDYNSAEGTSLATPVAAGVAALMLSVAPSLTATQVRDILRFTADKVGPVPYTNGWNGYYGAGRVNASNALAVAYAPSCLGIPILVTSLGDSGPGTLREAIQRANASSCTGTISLVVTGVISLASDLPAVTTMGPLSILGPGTNALTISGGNAARLFAFAANTQGRVSGLKLANGFSVNHGAAIQNSGSLVIESCLLVSNAVVNSFGGAICNFPGGTVLATNCVFTANTIRGGNGENRGPGSNGGPGGGGAGMGGAIFTEGTGLTLGGCTFLNNTAYGGNGGNGDGNGFNSDPGGNGGFPNAGTGGPVGQPGGPGGFGGGGGGGAGSFVSGAFAGGAGGFGGGGGAGGANGSGGNGGAAGAGGLYGGAAGASFSSHSGGGGGGAGLGGALFAHTGAITIVNCAFTGNLATNGVGGAGSFGGGIGSSGQGSGGAVFNHTAKITLAGVNTFSGNVASSGTPDLEASTLVTTVADSGLGSLRQAICNAAARPGADTVTFAPDLSGGVIALTSESLVITNHDGPLTITATNLPGGITISGENARNVFIVMPGESLTLDSLTISNGHAVSLFSFAPLGGGLWNYNGTALVRHCTFVNNDATFGGAMMCYQGSLTAETCTFSGNQASTSGGAIETGAGVPQVALRHCTIISNTATSSGGGIRFNSGSVTMNHCLIGGNTAPTGPDVNRVSATYASATYNLLRDGTTSGLTSGANGNLVGTAGAPIDPRLGPLQNNGGPTLTMSPLPGSPARDAGDPGFDGTGLTDQRGSNRVVYGRVDIGSVEAAVGLHTYYTFDGFGITDTLGFSSLTYQGDGPAWYNSDHRGQANSAIALNDPGFGTNNYYRINTVHDLTNSARGLGLQGDFTVSAWIYPRVLGGWKVLLGAVGPGSPGSVLFGLFDNHTYMAFWNNDIQGSRTIPLNAWTHLAFTYRAHGGEMAIYVNGLLDYADFGRSNSVRNGDVLLGFTEAIAGSYFQGFVDEFAVYCAALSPNQIEALANNSVFPNGTLPEPAIAPFAAADSCFWSVREIYSHPVGLWGRASAEAVATAPQLGSVSNYTSLVINRRDPETNFGPGSGFFNGDLPWAINNRTPQGLINGDDDNFALAAHATILIHDEDDYTFGFNSDDGARLRVFGAVFTNSSFVGDTNNPNPAIPAHRGDLLNYPRPTGASGILGVTHLKPGSYDIEFLTWEVTGGSFAEVFAAHGVKTTVDGTFRLLSPGLFAPPPTLAIERTSPAQIKVTWAPPTGCLQAASSLTGPWTETGTTNGQTIAISAGMQFFRVTQ